MENSLTGAKKHLITVAICTRNRVQFLEKAVRSVAPQMTGETELLIVDNASNDGTLEFSKGLAAGNPKIRFIREEELGLSAARNAALACSQSSYILFLDDDAIAQPGWLATYVEFLSRAGASGVVAVGGPVVPDFEVPPPAWLSPKCGMLDYGKPERELQYEAGPWGGNIAYDREAVLAAGNFNTALGRKGNAQGAHEEYEMNLRLRERGGKIWWLPNASILHFMPADRVQLTVLMRKEMAEGVSSALIRLQKRNGAKRVVYLLSRIVIGPFHCFANLLVSLFALPFRNGQIAARSLMRAARIAGFSWQMLLFATKTNAFSNKS